MKKILFIIILLIFATSIIPKGSTKALKSKLINSIHILQKKGFNVDVNRSVADTVKKGKSFRYKVQMYAGTTYAIVAVGDETVQDLDIYIYDENMNVVGRDSDSSSSAVTTIIPRWTGYFYIKVELFKGKDKDGWVASVLAYK